MRAENPLGVRSGLWPLRFQLCSLFLYLTLPYLCVRASFITDITHSPQNIFESYTVINAAVKRIRDGHVRHMRSGSHSTGCSPASRCFNTLSYPTSAVL